jgi:Putative zinc-finger
LAPSGSPIAIDNVANELSRDASDFPMLIENRLCSRARFWVSLRLDDQLSELEEALLDAHLRGCAPCRSFAGDSAVTTRELRAAPLEAHASVAVSLPHRRTARPLMVALTAALLAGAAVAGGLVRNVLAPASESAPAPRPVAVVASTFELNDQARRLWSASLGKKPSSHDFSV